MEAAGVEPASARSQWQVNVGSCVVFPEDLRGPGTSARDFLFT